MYYDLIFPYKVKEGCAMGVQEDGEMIPIYTQLTIERAKNPIDEQEYDAMHNRMRQQIADLLHEDIEMVICITGEEYEANVAINEEDEDDGNVYGYEVDD